MGFVLAYDHSQPGQPPRLIPERWLGASFAKQFSLDKPRVNLGAAKKNTTTKADSATDKKE